MPTAVPIGGQLAAALGLDQKLLPDKGDGNFFQNAAIKSLVGSHPGLLLDCYLPFDRSRGWKFDSENKGPFLRAFLGEANKALARTDAPWRSWSRRHRALYPKENRRVAVSAWRWIIGLGNNTVLETGLTLHHIYSVPYIPGSALKGLAQALALRKEEPAGLLPPEGPDRDEALLSIFGQHPDEKQQDKNRAGEIVFVGAVPVHDQSPPKLVLDVMTPHFSTYYGGKVDTPLEVEDPIPVPFLAIQGGTYDVTLAPRRRGETRWLDVAFRLCLAALDDIGIGGKTAKGYGYFETKEK